MLAPLLWAGFQEDWLLELKVTFDGPNRKIIVNPGVTDIDIKVDIYSAWKQWVTVRDNSKFLPALRTIGGDPAPLGSGLFAGDLYFLLNGWQITVNETGVEGTGIIFHDDGIPVFDNFGIPLLVSNLAFSVAPDAATIAAANQPILDAVTGIDGKIDAQDVVLSALEADIQLVRAVTAGRAIITPDDLTITVYDTDNTTVLATYAVSADGRTRTRTS